MTHIPPFPKIGASLETVGEAGRLLCKAAVATQHPFPRTRVQMNAIMADIFPILGGYLVLKGADPRKIADIITGKDND